MKRKLLMVLAVSILLVSCGGPGSNTTNRPTTRGELIEDITKRYEQCLEGNMWSRTTCTERYERQIENALR